MSARQILLVDDDADIRRTLGEILEDCGYITIGAANGREALDTLKAGARPCVILLDLMMPIMDGYQFLAQQSEDPKLSGIPVVVITAGVSVRDDVGVNAVMHKPLRLEKLMAVIGEVCQRA